MALHLKSSKCRANQEIFRLQRTVGEQRADVVHLKGRAGQGWARNYGNQICGRNTNENGLLHAALVALFGQSSCLSWFYVAF